MPDRKFNFSAGPAVLPDRVIRHAQSALWTLGDTGIGVMEHSHRGAAFSEILAQAEERCRKLAAIPENYSVLWLHGGASMQFAMVPMNLTVKGRSADYVDTGTWSRKAITQSQSRCIPHARELFF